MSEGELDSLIAEFLTAAERGDHPDPVDWMVRNPRCAAEFATFLADLSRFEGTKFDQSLSGHQREGRVLPESLSGEAAGIVDFGDYELVGAPLGMGGMGVVYRARLKGTSVEVALKRLVVSPNRTGRRMTDEIEAAAALRHPHIVPVYHAGEYQGEPYFTMALIEGGPLGQHLEPLRRDRRFATQLLSKVARAVHFAHQRRILHRDLKPSNILLDEHREPHVADFGLAERLTESGLVEHADWSCGSLPWMAPEILQVASAAETEPSFSLSPAITTAVDVWALGVILYELLTGSRPFRGETTEQLGEAIQREAPRRPRDVDATIPRDLEAVCLRCLEKAPARRYESASAVALELDRWLRDEPVRARQASLGERMLRWCRRAPGMAAAVVTGAAILLVLTLVTLPLLRLLREAVVSQLAVACEYKADHVAANVATRLDNLGNAVLVAAAELAKKSMAEGDLPSSWSKDNVPMPFAQTLKSLSNASVPPVWKSPFHNVFLLDTEGRVAYHSNAEIPETDRQYKHRDYFKHAVADKVYVSHAYHSDLDDRDKIALSTRFQFKGHSPEWVLSATLMTSEKLDLGSVTMSDKENTTILVAKRDVNPDKPLGKESPYVILMHPALEAGAQMVPFKGSLKLSANGRPFATDTNYRDPLAGHSESSAARWVLAWSRVGESELYVGVQANLDDALAPFHEFLRRMGLLLLAALSFGILLFAIFRGLRRWNSASN
jgi:hypothetical protein